MKISPLPIGAGMNDRIMNYESEHIIKNGAKRLRHGTYKSVYLDNNGKGRRYWRGEVQTINAGGVVRLRRWFKNREEAVKWISLR